MLVENKQAVEVVYKNLVDVGNDIVNEASASIDKMVKKLKREYTTMSNSELCKFITELSVELYFFGQQKDRAILEQMCADALYKNGLAREFVFNEGSILDRQTIASINNNDKLTVKLLYDLVSNSLKTKLDEAHRLITVINNIVISRNAEAKLAAGCGN